VLKFGNLEISFAVMKHPVKCFGVSVYNGSKRFVFSGDTAWDQNIIEFSRGADLVMLDAGLLSKDKKSDNVPHLTARECGLVAKEAGVSMLLLTHFGRRTMFQTILPRQKKTLKMWKLPKC